MLGSKKLGLALIGGTFLFGAFSQTYNGQFINPQTNNLCLRLYHLSNSHISGQVQFPYGGTCLIPKWNSDGVFHRNYGKSKGNQIFRKKHAQTRRREVSNSGQLIGEDYPFL